MHKYRKTIVFFAGVIAGIIVLHGIQSLANYDSIAKLLADETSSAVIRNYGLLAAGLIGLFVGSVRLAMASERQSQDKRSDLFERFQKSSHMLDSENVAVRQAGLYTLAEIAKEQPSEFYIMVQSLFCGFLRHSSNEQRTLGPNIDPIDLVGYSTQPSWLPIRPDMEDALRLFSRLRTGIDGAHFIERRERYQPDLSGLFVPKIRIEALNLAGVNLTESVFSDSILESSNFTKSILNQATFDRASLTNCQFQDIKSTTLFIRWTRFFGGKISGDNITAYYHGSYGSNTQFRVNSFDEFSIIVPGSEEKSGFPNFVDEIDYNAAKQKCEMLESKGIPY